MTTLRVYGDFSDPWSWFASLRVDALRRRPADSPDPPGSERIDVRWRAVIEHPSIWVTPQPRDSDQRARFAALTDWHRGAARSGEPEPPAPRATVPWGEPAVAGYAEAVGAGVGDHVRHLLFDRYWWHEDDIGNPSVVRHLLTVPILHGNSTSDVLSETGDCIALHGGPYTSGAFRRIRAWRRDWEALGCPPLPALVEGTTVTVGLRALDRLGELAGPAGVVPAGEVSTYDPYPLPRMPLPAQRVSHERPGLRSCWWDA